MLSIDPNQAIPNLKVEGLGYRPQLDGLRAIAVFLVMLQHFPLPNYLKFLKDSYVGGVGVDLFFVLSGFLITSILLSCRQISESSRQHKYNEIKMFYIRRFLRIFPLFYLTLFSAAIVNVGYVRETFFWNYFYLINFYMALKGVLLGAITHFWSLAVEEQFYLIWPWVIIFISRKLLFRVILVFIICGPCFRIISVLAGLNGQTHLYMPFASWDALGMGALLAYFCHEKKDIQVGGGVRRLINAGLLICLPLFLIDLFLRGMLINLPIQKVFSKLVMAFFFMWVIYYASKGFKGIAGMILGNRCLVYLGKISYGLYIFHNFMPGVVKRIFPLFHASYPTSEGLTSIIMICFTIIIASASWYLFERPLNNLKRFFKYQAHFSSTGS